MWTGEAAKCGIGLEIRDGVLATNVRSEGLLAAGGM